MPTRQRCRKIKKSDIPERYEPGYLSKLDRRTGISKLLRQNYDIIASELGGEGEISHVKAALVERFVFLEATLGKIEADMATDPDNASDEMGRWIQAVNSLTGLAKTLGIERKVGGSPWINAAASTKGGGKESSDD